MILSNAEFGVSNSRIAPPNPPARVARKRALMGISRIVWNLPRYAHALVMLPGYNAIVLDMFAETDGIPA